MYRRLSGETLDALEWREYHRRLARVNNRYHSQHTGRCVVGCNTIPSQLEGVLHAQRCENLKFTGIASSDCTKSACVHTTYSPVSSDQNMLVCQGAAL